MDYFVCIENTPCQQWQAELLIESFKHHGLEDQLVVGLILSDLPAKKEFCRNLYGHPRTHALENKGKVRGYDRLNRLYAMSSLQDAGLLKQPFLAIEPDCVLHKPFQRAPLTVPQVVFQVNPFFTADMARDNVPNLENYLPERKGWTGLAGPIYFNNVPMPFFERANMMAEILAYEQVKAGKDIWKYTDRVAWVVNLMDLVGQSVVEGLYTMEMSLFDHGLDHNLVSYERGAQPHFAKSMYAYAPPAMFSFGDPFAALAELPSHFGTSSVGYISMLAKKVMASGGHPG